jgi:hypothetical protein
MAVTVPKPTTVDSLRTALERAWNSIPQPSIDELCRSFRSRLSMCVNQGGQSISRDLCVLSDERFME